jgi:hypothetical protein
MRRPKRTMLNAIVPALAMLATPAHADTLTLTVRVHVPPTCRAVADGTVQCNDARITPVIRQTASAVPPQTATDPHSAIVTLSIAP